MIGQKVYYNDIHMLIPFLQLMIERLRVFATSHLLTNNTTDGRAHDARLHYKVGCKGSSSWGLCPLQSLFSWWQNYSSGRVFCCYLMICTCSRQWGRRVKWITILEGLHGWLTHDPLPFLENVVSVVCFRSKKDTLGRFNARHIITAL